MTSRKSYTVVPEGGVERPFVVPVRDVLRRTAVRNIERQLTKLGARKARILYDAGNGNDGVAARMIWSQHGAWVYESYKPQHFEPGVLDT